MSLNRLHIQPESHILSDVSVVTNVTTPIVVPESDEQPELPELDAEDLRVSGLVGFGTFRNVEDPLAEAYIRLGEIKERLGLEGLIDIATAKEIDQYIPDFYDTSGGGSTFTYSPSIEGLSIACEAIDSAILTSVADGFKKLAAWAVSVYNRFAEWVNKFLERMKNSGNAGNTNLMSDINEKNRAAFNSGEGMFKLLDAIVESPERVSALLFSGIEAGGGVDASQSAALDRAKELFEQSAENVKTLVDRFKTNLGSSSYGKEMFGVVDTGNRVKIDAIKSAAKTMQSIDLSIKNMLSINGKDHLLMEMQGLEGNLQRAQEAIIDTTNEGDGDHLAEQISKKKLQDIYKVGKAYVAMEKNTSDASSMGDVTAAVTYVKSSMENISKSVEAIGNHLPSIRHIDEETIAAAKSLVNKAISACLKLIESLTTQVKIINGATGGKVMFISEAAKLVNQIKPLVSRIIAPLAPETKKTVTDNLMRHYSVTVEVSTAV